MHLVSKCKVLYLGGYLLMESVRPEEFAENLSEGTGARRADRARCGGAETGGIYHQARTVVATRRRISSQ